MTTTVRPPPRDTAPQAPPAAPARPPPLPAARPAAPRPTAPATMRPAPPPPARDFPGVATEGSRFGVSGRELVHLAVGVTGLSVAFAFALSHPPTSLFAIPDDRQVAVALSILPYAAAVVALGFLLHEMAHKVVAQHFYMWAEFRSQASGLLIAVGLGVLTPFILAVPGAVMIGGAPTRRENGLISAVGPAVNVLIGFAAFPFIGSAANPIEVGPNIGNFPQLVAIVNAYLAAFNMFPVAPLDGSKILKWSIPAYVAMLVPVALLFALVSGLRV